LLARLLHAGLRRKDGLFATGVLHLWHPDADRSNLPANEQRLAEVVASRREQAERGISTLGPDPPLGRTDCAEVSSPAGLAANAGSGATRPEPFRASRLGCR
jgi:hypothetical protein